MQWGQIKTLLILCFLLLNIYLLYQFLDKQSQADLGVLEPQEATIEEQLKAESITIGNLPQEEYEETFLAVKPKTFTKRDLKSLDDLVKQKYALINKNFLVSQFEEPIPIPKNISAENMEELIKDKMLFADEYMYWNWNKTINALIFFQKKADRPVYFNQNGLILVYLNENNEMTFYTQTMLGETEPRAEKRKLIKPIRAIETLYESNELNSGDELTSVNIGFHTRVPLDSGVQVFAPIWKVNINNERDYFVNAIEGFVFSSDELNFLEETMTMSKERVQSMKENEVMKVTIINILNTKIDMIRGDT